MTRFGPGLQPFVEGEVKADAPASGVVGVVGENSDVVFEA
jgi:hypothetical protein